MKTVILIFTALLAAVSLALGPFLGGTAALFLLPGAGWIVAAEYALMFAVTAALFIESLRQHWHASPARLLGWAGAAAFVASDMMLYNTAAGVCLLAASLLCFVGARVTRHGIRYVPTGVAAAVYAAGCIALSVLPTNFAPVLVVSRALKLAGFAGFAAVCFMPGGGGLRVYFSHFAMWGALLRFVSGFALLENPETTGWSLVAGSAVNLALFALALSVSRADRHAEALPELIPEPAPELKPNTTL